MVDMRKALLSGVAVAAIFGGCAMAADMPPPYRAPPPQQQFYSWTGFYLGTHTGVAVVANVKNTATDLDGGLVVDPSDFSSTSKAQWGWTVGSGFEYAIASSWTVKSEYLYMDFGKERSTNLDGDTFEHKNRLHTWKVGLNYKWGATLY